jgi:hypothetical protein
MTFEEAREIFLNRGYEQVDGGSIYNADKWRDSVIVISDWLQQEPADAVSRADAIKAVTMMCEERYTCLDAGGRDGCELGGDWNELCNRKEIRIQRLSLCCFNAGFRA